ncbi:hypothetical protein KSP39_PZI006245 [Platanthera zijinensis]|uniref:Dehydrogenase/reductase SDR family member on chromosome X n=1 Tax=Platanthera zijinensis TaxID=2320716 RepID=A0AAP0BUI7_9ASPA
MGIDQAAIHMLLSPQFWRMAVFWSLALIYSYLRLHFAVLFSGGRRTLPPRRRFSPDPAAEVQRPICIITGATSGLGKAAALAMASEGYHVVLAGRCAKSLSKTIQEIMQENEGAHLNSFQVDMSSIDSIVKFERSFKRWLLDSNLHPSVQLLLNNAGILATSSRNTDDGYDQMMQTNYMSAFVLTNLLLPLLKKSPVPSRIVNVTSFTHHCVTSLKLDYKLFCHAPTSAKYPFAQVYEYSKLCLLLFSYELHRRLHAETPSSNISIIAVDPGVVQTRIMREIPVSLSRLAFAVLKFLHLLQSPEVGVSSIVDAALAPPKTSGEYFFGGMGGKIKSSSLSYNPELAAELWLKSSMLFQKQMNEL